MVFRREADAATGPVPPVRRRERSFDRLLGWEMPGDSNGSRPVLAYPLEWEYRVIGADESAVRAAIVRVMGARSHSVAAPKLSRAGRWVSLHVQLVVHTEEERDSLHRELVADPAVRLVM